MSDKHLTEKVNVRATPPQLSRWMKAAEKARRKLSDWVRLALDEAAEREERG